MDDTSGLAANIRAELARRGKTQQELAAHLGMSPKTLSDRLSSEERAQQFRLSEIRNVARFLSVPVERLVPAMVQ